MVLRLVTLPISHYCEKARWALDRVGMFYREERDVQGIRQRAARRACGGSTVPVLVTADRVIGDSAEILAWVDERTPPESRLFPAQPGARGEIEALCERFDEVLGPRAGVSCMCACSSSEARTALQQPGRAVLGGPRDPSGLASIPQARRA